MSTIGIIGYGKAARALEGPLKAAGHTLAFIWQRQDGPLSEVPHAPYLILAVQDTLIADTAQQLASRPQAADEVWLHLSGVTPVSALRVTPHLPQAVGNLHPLVALTPETQLKGCVAGVDGDELAKTYASQLALALGLHPVAVPAEKRALYHAAAVMVAGHATALFAMACQVMEGAGLSAQESRQALLPLMGSALGNLQHFVPALALTGPIARGDVSTIQHHLGALALNPEWAQAEQVYRVLALASLEVVRERIDSETVTQLETSLNTPASKGKAVL